MYMQYKQALKKGSFVSLPRRGLGEERQNSQSASINHTQPLGLRAVLHSLIVIEARAGTRSWRERTSRLSTSVLAD